MTFSGLGQLEAKRPFKRLMVRLGVCKALPDCDSTLDQHLNQMANLRRESMVYLQSMFQNFY